MVENGLSGIYIIQQPDYSQKRYAIDLPGKVRRWKALSLDCDPSGPYLFYWSWQNLDTTRRVSQKRWLISLRGKPVDALYFQTTSELTRLEPMDLRNF